jgi:hypothetical protein
MAMFMLFYRSGSFARSAKFDTREAALSGAYDLIHRDGNRAFSIETDGIIVLHNSQIEEHCDAAKVVSIKGRMPARSA